MSYDNSTLGELARLVLIGSHDVSRPIRKRYKHALSAAGFDPDGMLDDIHGLLWTVRVLSNILRHVAREDIVSDVDIANFEKEKKILQSKLDARTVRPRFGDRDREVVRLRDEEKLTFGQIAKQIRITVAWQRTQNGALFNADAAKKAYSRHKNRSTDGDK